MIRRLNEGWTAAAVAATFWVDAKTVLCRHRHPSCGAHPLKGCPTHPGCEGPAAGSPQCKNDPIEYSKFWPFLAAGQPSPPPRTSWNLAARFFGRNVHDLLVLVGHDRLVTLALDSL